MRRTLQRLPDYLIGLARRLREDRGFETAGSLTYTTLLALVPLVAVVLAIASPFPIFDRAMNALGRFITTHLLPDGGAMVTRQVSAFAAKAGQLTRVGVAFLVVTAFLLMNTVDGALHRIFRVQRRRPLLRRLLVYWAVLTFGPVLIGAGLWMTSTLVVNSFGLLDLNEEGKAVLRLLPFGFTCAALTLLYLLVPNRRVGLARAASGGIVAGVLFEFAKRGFGLYVVKLPTYTLIYGALAVIPLLLMWMYLSWVIVLFGATLTASLLERVPQ
jgi:membrane protein